MADLWKKPKHVIHVKDAVYESMKRSLIGTYLA